MKRFCGGGSLRNPAALVVLSSIPFLASGWSKKTTSDMRVVRWTEGVPGSSFAATEDGKYLYALKDEDLELNVVVDSQELQKIRHRPLPILALRIDAQYSGNKPLDLDTGHMSLEFVRHYQVLNTSLDPDELGTRIQRDVENLSDEVERGARKHPQQKQDDEISLQAHLKDMTDLLGFISAHCLRDVTLDAGHPQVSGWVFFSAKSKWIGAWKPQEDFVLRIPLKERVFQFPFSLPPRKGALFLRHRNE